jgi:RNA-dependent RNA polymerase
LHSDAVDYPKSGQPVALSTIPGLRSRDRPDWNAPETANPDPNKGYYKSQRAIGRLFREIDLPEIPRVRRVNRKRPGERTTDKLANKFKQVDFTDEDLKDALPQALRDRVSKFIDIDEITPDGMVYVQQIFRRYAAELQAICTANALSQTYASLSEEEAVTGTIAQKTSQPRKRKDAMAKLREQTDILVRGVREELAGDGDTPLEVLLKRAWVAWKLSVLEREVFGGQSFGWVALGAIFELIKDIEEEVLKKSRSMLHQK